MKKIILIILVSISFIGLMAFRSIHKNPIPLKIGYIMYMSQTTNGVLIATSKRMVKGNGEFMEIKSHFDKTGTLIGEDAFAGTLANGAVRIHEGSKTLEQIGRAAIITSITPEEIKIDSSFIGKNTHLGYDVYTQKNCDTMKRCTEYWIAPELGSDDIKIIFTDSDGTSTVREATSIVKGEPQYSVPNYRLVKAATISAN